MYHVALYDTEKHEVVGVEEYADKNEALLRADMFDCEARARGGDWKPYFGEKPFEWEKSQEGEE